MDFRDPRLFHDPAFESETAIFAEERERLERAWLGDETASALFDAEPSGAPFSELPALSGGFRSGLFLAAPEAAAQARFAAFGAILVSP